MFFLVVLSCVAISQAQLLQHILPHAQPYDFGYSVKDHHSEQHRQETGDGHGAVVGSYGFKDARGIARQVNYVADHGGFRAHVNTNEPGTANQNPAAVHLNSHQPHVLKVVEPHHAHPVAVAAVPTVHGPHHAHPVSVAVVPTVHGDRHGDYHHGVPEPVHGHPVRIVAVPFVHGLDARHGLGHGDYRVGHHGHGDYRVGHHGHGYRDALAYTDLLGDYNGGVKYAVPLVGGAVRGYDSRVANVIV